MKTPQSSLNYLFSQCIAGALFLFLFTNHPKGFSNDSLNQEYHEVERIGIEQLPKHHQSWLHYEETTLEKIRRKIKKKSGVKSLYHSFRMLEKTSEFLHRRCRVAKRAVNQKKNRYQHHIPYDETRSLRNLKGFYYNASDIVTPQQKYIICSAPFNNTLKDFWKMIIRSNVHTIVTLNTPYEKGYFNVVEYWDEGHSHHIIDHRWKIASISESLCRKKKTNDRNGHKVIQKIILRRFILEDLSTLEKNRTIMQIHYENWPDEEVPQCDLLHLLFDIADMAQKPFSKNDPILVHCSAGIGRSGVFVAAHSLRKELLLNNSTRSIEKELINVPKRIIGLRFQRMKLISNFGQYKSVLEVLCKSTSKKRR